MASGTNTALRVPVIDDEQGSSTLVTVVLNSLGVTQIDEDADGNDASRQIQAATEPHGLIICDWEMPGMTGLELLEKLRAAGNKTPFVMLTAKTGTMEFNDAKHKGADYFLMKPLDVDGLKMRLGSIVSKAAAAH